ncbi:hypothetical protein EPN90_03400 [Patescibacteria group bacterium]|nr:MAG: hypothetical protein EPN90_03400 [Patescibacteria group bacterium]
MVCGYSKGRIPIILAAALLLAALTPLPTQAAVGTVLCSKDGAPFKCSDEININNKDEYAFCGCQSAKDCSSKKIQVETPSAKCSQYNTAPTGGAAGPTSRFRLPSGDLPSIFGRAIRLILGVSGSIAFGAILFGGFLWLTSGGSPETITKARNIIVWAGLGLLVIFASYALVSTIITSLSGAVGVAPK